MAQSQPGYAVAIVCLPLGDITSAQLRALVNIARHYNGGHVRTTVEQNIVLRWISQADLPALYADLASVGLAQSGASTLVDITACPGTDTCKLGISSSRGLAAELRKRIMTRNGQLDEAVKDLKIKVSGCFNSCGQHHVADIGFYGVSRKVGQHVVPPFQVVLGGAVDGECRGLWRHPIFHRWIQDQVLYTGAPVCGPHCRRFSARAIRMLAS